MQLHFVVNNSEISTLFVVELLPLRICPQLISMNSQSLKNKCNPAMHTPKKNWRTCCNNLELFCFFSTPFFLQNGYVEEGCLQKGRSHVLIYKNVEFVWGLAFCSWLQHAKKMAKENRISSKHWYTKSSLQFDRTRVSEKRQGPTINNWL